MKPCLRPECALISNKADASAVLLAALHMTLQSCNLLIAVGATTHNMLTRYEDGDVLFMCIQLTGLRCDNGAMAIAPWCPWLRLHDSAV